MGQFERLTPEEQAEALQKLPPSERENVVNALPPEEHLGGPTNEQIRQYLERRSAEKPASPRKQWRKK